MPEVIVSRKCQFSAAHRLCNPEKSDSWNLETYGACNHSNWHGHNYDLEVFVAGMPDADTGFVIDLSVLQKILDDVIICKCDHKNLNLDVDFLKGIIPSTENLVVAFWNQLKDTIKPGRLYCIRLAETGKNTAEYRGD